LCRTFHGCFLPSVGSFGQAVSEENIFLEIDQSETKNCLWWPYLLANRSEMSNRYRGSSIDAAYQVSVHLAKQFREDCFEINQSETRIACVGHVC
jgi:hypothetical protein